MTAAPTLLQVKRLGVSFGARQVVHELSFDLAAGEKLALVGESGSGKTVTALSLMRLLPDAVVSGSVDLFRSKPNPIKESLLSISEQAMRGIRGREIAMIFQEPMTALNPLLTIGDQITEVLRLQLGLDARAARERAVELLAETGIQEPAKRVQAYPHQLSGGQRQRAMIAMALACKPRLLLADEPTTALDVSLRGQILDLLDTLRERHGMAVLMITHDLNLVRRFADRVIVMENGVQLEQGAVPEVFSTARHPYTRRLLDSRPQRDPASLALEPSATPVLEAQALSVSYPVPLPGLRGWFRRGAFPAVRQASFTIRAGQTLGVIGESGSGKSTLALAALGLLPADGMLRVQGQSWQYRAGPDQPLRKIIQVVFQDPFSSLSPRMTVEEIVGEGLRVHHPGLSGAQRRQQVIDTLARVGLSLDQFPDLLSRYPQAFSGGQRQRIAIARALVVQPQVLVLDEPTSALDVTIQKQVLTVLQQLQRELGLSYLLITHDVDVIRAMAHQVLVMKDGAVVESGPVEAVLQHPQHPYTQVLVQASC